MKKKEILSKLDQLENMYLDLLWYARVNPDNLSKDGVQKRMKEVEEMYPEEVRQLKSPEGNWVHGFNSGAIAMIRYIQTLYHEGEEQANREFPMLDS